MTLRDVISDIDKCDTEDTIYAQKPWHPSSEAALAVEGSADEERIKKHGLDYFLESFVAREFLEDWRITVDGGEPTLDEICQRLIRYAIDDA